MAKSKKTLEASLDLTPSFMTSVDGRVEEVLFRIWIILKIGAVILFKRNMAEKDVCRTYVPHSHVPFSREINKGLSKQPK